MALHHRHKQRILTTLVSLITFIIAVDAYLILSPVMDMGPALLFSFAIAIGLITAYQCYNYRHSHEHITLVNTLTQIFMGSILFGSTILILLLNAFFGVDILTGYLVLSLLVIVLTFVFLKRFDQFLETEVQAKFPMGVAPSPARENPVKKMAFKHRK